MYVIAASPTTSNSDRLHMGRGSNLEIFYQNVRGLTTKFPDIFNNVHSVGYTIICLTET
jgi:hypothetical protein